MSTLAEALAPKSDQLSGDDLLSGPRTITFTRARVIKTARETKITLNFEGDNGKPFKPCKTMGRAMVLAWGITDDGFEEQFIGKSVRVFRDPTVTFGSEGQVGGVRITHMSHIEKAVRMKLTVSQGKKAEFVFQPLPRSVEGGDQDGALVWANGFIKLLGQKNNLPQLNEFAAGKAKKLEELGLARPELHERCIAALADRRAELSPNDGTFDPDDNPTAKEGPDDIQRGDQFTDADDAD